MNIDYDLSLLRYEQFVSQTEEEVSNVSYEFGYKKLLDDGYYRVKIAIKKDDIFFKHQQNLAIEGDFYVYFHVFAPFCDDERSCVLINLDFAGRDYCYINNKKVTRMNLISEDFHSLKNYVEAVGVDKIKKFLYGRS